MKYLFILLLLMVGCAKQDPFAVEGTIVRMTYNPYNEANNNIILFTERGTMRIHGCPYFAQLKVGDTVKLKCEGTGVMDECFITDKVRR